MVVVIREAISFLWLFRSRRNCWRKDKSDYKRYSLRFNNTYNVFENKTNKFFRSFKVGTNLGYTRIISKGISENDNFSGPLASAVMTPPNESVYLENPSAEDLAYYEKIIPVMSRMTKAVFIT